ncbi:MAG: hypothetical protein AUH28_16325 [Acidobacteria bacterium 13_1_40CM_56_16]|nr:MAG: hypothetical protein AUH28_16325 [Acidobacteria bacterium 13_1_40CM_56_16]
MERRFYMNAALRAEASASGARVLRGYAARYNVTTKIAGQFHERLAPGSFTSALKRGDETLFLVDHAGQPMARTKNGTLRLGEDKQGLFFSAQLPNTTAAKDLFEQVRVGNMDECSFAFSVAPGDDDWDDGYDCPDEDCCARGSRGLPRRTIKSLRLFDCSCVSRPAYPQTSISATATYMDVSSADDDDDNGADGAGDPWYQASGVIVSAEARNRARRAHRHTAAQEAHDFASQLFRATIRATRDLSRQ